MKTAREFYEYHGVKPPKKLLPREEFMFEKLNEDLDIVANANTQLSVDLATEKVEKSQVEKSLCEITRFDAVVNSSSHIALFFLGVAISLIGSITLYSNVIEEKDTEINKLINSNQQIKELKSDLKVANNEKNQNGITGLILGVLLGGTTAYVLKD